MSANLDKSLDEIIGENKKVVRRTNKKAPKKVSKQLNGNRRRGGAVVGGRTAVPVKAASLLDAAYATKVNVEGLPRDIKQDAVRVCSISQCSLESWASWRKRIKKITASIGEEETRFWSIYFFMKILGQSASHALYLWAVVSVTRVYWLILLLLALSLELVLAGYCGLGRKCVWTARELVFCISLHLGTN